MAVLQAHETLEFEIGRQDFVRCRRVDDCPYSAHLPRVRWLSGWYAERTGQRLAEVFKRTRIEWP